VKLCPRCNERFDDPTRFCPHDGVVLEPAPDDPHIGQVIMGQFELRAPLGKGAMGTVYRAWQMGMEREVAVKVLHPHLVTDPEVLERFAREARAVARLSHPNIVTVFVIGQTGEGTPCLVMEYVDGVELDAVLDGRALPSERAARVVRQIASALAEAHGAGIVHRDLKPANVILTQRRRSADFVKILDFGIAKIVGTDSLVERGSDLTREGEIFGTPYYLSPEQATGGAIYRRSDIYSVGVMLYRMLCGRLPFAGNGVQALLGHVNDPVPHPRDVAPGVAESLAAIALRCLEKDPASRYQTAEALADAIDGTAGVSLTPWASGIYRAADVLPVDPTGQAPTVVIPGASGSVTAVVPASPLDDDAALTAEPAVAAPMSLDGSQSLAFVVPRRRWASTLASLLALLVVGAGAGVGVYAWRSAGRSHDTPPIAANPAVDDASTAVEPPAGVVDASTEEGHRTVIVSEAGYSFQALIPERMVTGVEYEIELSTWDPAGEPLTAPEVVLTVEEPGGSERGLAAKRTAAPGRYRFTRTFRVPGTHYLHIFPPSGHTNVKLWLDVLAPGRAN